MRRPGRGLLLLGSAVLAEFPSYSRPLCRHDTWDIFSGMMLVSLAPFRSEKMRQPISKGHCDSKTWKAPGGREGRMQATALLSCRAIFLFSCSFDLSFFALSSSLFCLSTSIASGISSHFLSFLIFLFHDNYYFL